jgi:hypothetical protein
MAAFGDPTSLVELGVRAHGWARVVRFAARRLGQLNDYRMTAD